MGDGARRNSEETIAEATRLRRLLDEHVDQLDAVLTELRQLAGVSPPVQKQAGQNDDRPDRPGVSR